MLEKNEPSGVEISLVVPMYNEAEVIHIFIETIESCLTPSSISYEVICVNDGSTDETSSILRNIAQSKPHIKVINLSRNFGKEQALTAGLDFAEGQAAIPIDCDLQDPPELILEMYQKWKQGFDMVLAKRINRESDAVLKRLSSSLFYNTIGRLSEIDIPENVGDFRLMDRKVINALKLYPERSRFMKGIFASLGFSNTTIEYERPERVAGPTKWSYLQLYKLAADGIISFTSVPLKIWSYVGAVSAITAFAYGLFLIIRTFIFGIDTPGYASLMVVLLIMSGLILMSLGIIGEYLARIFIEVKGRPMYIVMDTIGFDDSHNQDVS